MTPGPPVADKYVDPGSHWGDAVVVDVGMYAVVSLVAQFCDNYFLYLRLVTLHSPPRWVRCVRPIRHHRGLPSLLTRVARDPPLRVFLLADGADWLWWD